jgi:hypothetical protein
VDGVVHARVYTGYTEAWQEGPQGASLSRACRRGRDREMLRRRPFVRLWTRHIVQEEAAGKAEEGQGADAGVWQRIDPSESFHRSTTDEREVVYLWFITMLLAKSQTLQDHVSKRDKGHGPERFLDFRPQKHQIEAQPVRRSLRTDYASIVL